MSSKHSQSLDPHPGPLSEGERGPKYEPILHVVLHQPEIPPNTGNVARSCVAIGAKLWLVKPLGFEITEKRLRSGWRRFWLGEGPGSSPRPPSENIRTLASGVGTHSSSAARLAVYRGTF
jgi:hypothetical protein